jgi:glycosyltransferase involved in cell wall biosynthesis
MRLAFVDGTNYDYTPATPLERPLGGMQSALCYLATALAARGHSVTLFNATTTPGSYYGVSCERFDPLVGAALNAFDVVVSISVGSIAFREMGVRHPLVLWTGHDVDQRAIEGLRNGTERYLWDRIVLVSHWQMERYCKAFKYKREQISVLRNAVAPAFENTSRDQPYFFESGRPPVLFYSSTPARGLEVLLLAFPNIRKLVPGCEARIYSGMTVYQRTPERDPYRPLYERCRATEGVHYLGSIGQLALSQAVKGLDVFAYPSTFAETSCIVLMEAMASGCLVLSSALGALPETAAGFGRLCEGPPNATAEQSAELYARFAAQTINNAYKSPAQFSALMEAQKTFALKNYSWKQRAAEWETMLTGLSQHPPRLTAPRRNEPCPCGSGRRFKHCCGTIV